MVFGVRMESMMPSLGKHSSSLVMLDLSLVEILLSHGKEEV